MPRAATPTKSPATTTQPRAERSAELGSMQPQQQFQAVLTGESLHQRDQLDRLASQHPMEFRTWVAAWIANGGHGAEARLLLRLLHQKNLLRSLLVNPGALPLRDAMRIARMAQHSIANLDWTIADTIRRGTEEQAKRALQILHHLNLSSRVAPGLAAGLRNPNVRIRSLVSKLLGRMCDNPAAIEALLHDRDSRVRANAVEGLWGSGHPLANGLLRQCLRDPDNRVAVNAALGLAKTGDVAGIEALRRMSRHASPRYRISATWGIGQTADTALAPLLEILTRDRVPKVREAARAALARMLHPESAGGARLAVAVSQAYWRSESGLSLRAAVIGDEDNPLDLSADSFRVLQGDSVLPRNEVRPPARRDPLITVVWLADAELCRSTQDKAREAILAAMHYKRLDDVHCVVSCGANSTLALSADLGQLGDALSRARVDEAPRSGDSQAVFRALTLAGSRTGCRTVVAFAAGSPPERLIDIDALIRQAVVGRIAVHVVVFAHAAIAPAWSRIASQTQGSYRVVKNENELQDAFWSVISRISSAHEITCLPDAGSEGEFRLEVRCAEGYGETRFEPLRIEDGM